MTNADGTGFEADLDVMDEHGTVLLSMQGLQIGTGATEDANRDRVLNERLLTVEWRQRQLPAACLAKRIRHGQSPQRATRSDVYPRHRQIDRSLRNSLRV